MFTPEDREELISIFSKLKEEVADTLENDNVLPSSISNSGGKVRITIELQKLYPESVAPSPPPKE